METIQLHISAERGHSKVIELPYHLLEVAKLIGKENPEAPEWDAVADLLTNWHFLEAKAEA